MRVYSAEDVKNKLKLNKLIEAIKHGFQSDITIPLRHHHKTQHEGMLLLMPAFNSTYLGTKIVSVFPHNATLNLPAVQGYYYLANGKTGEPLALIEGKSLTALRTAAASALASSFLSRKNAKTLLMIGAGALAKPLIEAHCAVRPIEKILIWNRSPENALLLKAKLSHLPIEIITNLEEGLKKADIISSATLSSTPLIKGEFIKQGTHIDLVGGFTPQMREADDTTILKAKLYVDTFTGGLKEAGDIVDPLKRKIMTKRAIKGDLFSLCQDNIYARKNESDITLFKSVGTALEDLIAAITLFELN